MYTAQQSFRTVALRDLNPKIHTLWGKMKVVKICSIYFYTFWHLIRWNPLINDQVLKMTPKPIDWILHPWLQPILSVHFKTANFKSAAWSCDWSWRSINHEEWYQLQGHCKECRAEIQSKSSSYESYAIDLKIK